ncbi:thioredoxin family protein [Blastopirellula retiformator]|uniref:Thioredoxin n=1 Tax=Blastopirellula retiformator TaxID=2527970 RepID=A0A5C5VB65_9BACT|nr:thioredoxin family protein [Blastopirellula retiformator]TWT34932.1 Thioredoxin [Blastopirellula retiformator]
MPESPAPTSPPTTKRPLNLWRAFWLTFLVASLGYAWYCFYVPANSIAWAQDFPAAQQQAAESDKPMVLYFTGAWCVPCRIMKRQVWADEEVTLAVNGQFVPVSINVDSPENAEVLSRYNIGGAPVTIVTDAAGNALRWRVGGISKVEFLELLADSDATGDLGS